MPLNFDLAGKTYQGSVFVVEPEKVAAYHRATGSPDYLVDGEPAAGPLFPVVPAFPLMTRVSGDPELNVENPLKILHGSQELRYHRPLRVGETLELTPILEKVEDKGSGATFVVRIESVSPEGDPVVDQWWTIFVRGAGTGRPRPRREGPPPPQPEGGELARFTQSVDRDMPHRYAEASGDRNPIHLNEEVARSVGLPGVINHGLGTMALVAAGLVSHLLGDDLARLRRLSARFTAPVLPGTDITTAVSSGGREGLFLYETRRSDDRVAMTGEVETG